MITSELDGVIFDADVDAIVVTVNTVGEMGAGLALEARLRFPEMFVAYRAQCESGSLDVGTLWLWSGSTPQVLCFPTKRHWRNPSQVRYLRSGLERLTENYGNWGLRRVALPHLGADRGGLDWTEQVRPLVYELLDPLPDLDVTVYGYSPRAPERAFHQLRSRLQEMSVAAFAERSGLRRREAELVRGAVLGAPHPNLSVLHETDGIGITTLERVYTFLRSADLGPRQDVLPLD